MLSIIYCPEGESCSDFVAESLVDSLLKKYLKNQTDMTYKTSSELVFSYFVFQAISEKISLNDIEFFYKHYPLICDPFKGIEYPMDESGRKITFGFNAEIIRKIFYLGIEKMKKQNEDKGVY